MESIEKKKKILSYKLMIYALFIPIIIMIAGYFIWEDPIFNFIDIFIALFCIYFFGKKYSIKIKEMK